MTYPSTCIYRRRKAKGKKEQHVNLLFVQDYYVDEDEEEEDGVVPKFHYVWIKGLCRLVNNYQVGIIKNLFVIAASIIFGMRKN